MKQTPPPPPIKYTKPLAGTSAMQALIQKQKQSTQLQGRNLLSSYKTRGRFSRFQISGPCYTDIL